MSLTTDDCQKFLSTNSDIQKLVQGRYDPEEWDDKRHCLIIRKNAANPKKWVRQQKYNVGSPTDLDKLDLLQLLKDSKGAPDITGGVVREFWLKDTDHITILLVEKDDKIVFTEDLSD